MIYSISHILIALNSLHELKKLECFKPFEVNAVEEEYSANIIPVEYIETPDEVVSKCVEYLVAKESDEYCRYYLHPRIDNLIYAKSRWDWGNNKIVVEYIPRYQEFLSESGNTLFHIGLERILLRENRLIFHAACVDTTYGGILFTGPSGAGKSTQADLWIKYRSALLINGDRPILERTYDGWNAWGSPYAGSSRCYVNEKCSVRAIVKVVKADKNEVIQLAGARAFATIFSEITVNNWCREDVSMASELAIELINAIPVYQMYCTKTKEAVLILEEVLRGEANI